MPTRAAARSGDPLGAPRGEGGEAAAVLRGDVGGDDELQGAHERAHLLPGGWGKKISEPMHVSRRGAGASNGGGGPRACETLQCVSSAVDQSRGGSASPVVFRSAVCTAIVPAERDTRRDRHRGATFPWSFPLAEPNRYRCPRHATPCQRVPRSVRKPPSRALRARLLLSRDSPFLLCKKDLPDAPQSRGRAPPGAARRVPPVRVCQRRLGGGRARLCGRFVRGERHPSRFSGQSARLER